MADNNDNTSAYDDEILPVVTDLARRCDELNMPMFLAIQEDSESLRATTAHLDKTQWKRFQWMKMMNSAQTFDDFMELVMEDAVRSGHDSLYLQAMGIPMKAGSNRFPANWVKREAKEE